MQYSEAPPADPAAPWRVRGPHPDAVLVLHGFTSGPRSVRAWAEAALAAGHTVSVPLLPGHGTHWRDLARTDSAAWTAAAAAEFDVLQRDHRHVFVFGLSMGGALALELAARRAVAGLALVNPALTFADPLARYAGVLRHVVRSVAPIANDIALPGMDERAYPRTPVAGVHQLGRLLARTRAALPGVSCPVLVFRSATDRVVPESSLEELVAGLPAPPTVRRLDRSRHVATMDHDGPDIGTASVGFVAGIGGGRG